MLSLKKIAIGLAAALVLLFVGCQEDFDKINTSPNTPKIAIPSSLFTYAVGGLGYYNFDSWYQLRMSSAFVQQWCQTNYTDEDRYLLRASQPESFYFYNYTRMQQLQYIIKMNTDEATKADAFVYGDNGMQIAICEIIKCWSFQQLVDHFGDVPYSEAFDVEQHPQPKYDDAKEIYASLIAKLKEAKALLEASTTAGYAHDVVFDGNLSKWIKFANSLRLRLALRASNGDASYLAEAKSAIADGVMESVADNALVKFYGKGGANEAPIYSAYYTDARNDFTLTNSFVELMKGGTDNGRFVNPFAGIFDPRLAIYTGIPTDTVKKYNYCGFPYGMSSSTTASGYWSATNSSSDTLWNKATNSSYTVRTINMKNGKSAIVEDAALPSVLLDYPTVCFMVAEIENNDATWFQKGVEASMTQWNVPAAEASAYVTDVMAKYNAAPADYKKEMIITQKYIHLVTQGGEAWAEYRRTGYPRSLLQPGDTTLRWFKKDKDGKITGEAYVFTPANGETEIATRIPYPDNEATLNAANRKAAIDRMGSNRYDVHLWWDTGRDADRVTPPASTAPTTYAIGVAAGIENGTVSVNPTEAAEGAEVTITVTPADGYQLKAGTLKAYRRGEPATEVSINAENKFTMPAYDVEVSAEFEAVAP